MNQLDPMDYDIYHVGISGGKDSTACLLWLVYESGWPTDRIVATFCETDNEDPLTYAYLEMLSEMVHPIKTIIPIRFNNHHFPQGLGFYELAKQKKRFPSRKARFCTQWLKVIPSREYVLSLLQQGKKVLLVNGVRKEEGDAANGRGELSQFDWAEDYGCYIYRPVYHWSLDEVWEQHRKWLDLEKVLDLIRCDPTMASDKKDKLIAKKRQHKIPRNPLYDMGAVRVGCFPCINSRKAEIRAMDYYRPERIDFIEEKEVEVGEFRGDDIPTFFARNTVPRSHRTKQITTQVGERMKVATIRDVVQWSKTAYGGKQYDFDLEDVDDDSLSCSIGGYCE